MELTDTYRYPNYKKFTSQEMFASLSLLARDVIHLLYYEHWTNKRKCFYVQERFASKNPQKDEHHTLLHECFQRLKVLKK